MRRLLRGLVLTPVLLFVIWAAMALHFAPLLPSPYGDILAVVMLVLTAWLVWRLAAGRAALACLVAPALVLAAFLSLRPTNDADWAPEYARIPDVTIEGNTVHFTGLRNFDWHTPTEATPRYFDATYDLNEVESLDLILSYWAGDWIAHVFISFGFKDGRHLSFSVETRRTVGQQYSALAGFFRYYTLAYVAADERDLIGVRTDRRGERVFLYRLQTTQEGRRNLFLSYAREIQSLAKQPAFYNTLLDNCTTAIVTRIAAAAPDAPRIAFSWKLLLSGFADSYVYSIGRLVPGLPFAELRARSRIHRPEGAAITEDFSHSIRAGLPLEAATP